MKDCGCANNAPIIEHRSYNTYAISFAHTHAHTHSLTHLLIIQLLCCPVVLIISIHNLNIQFESTNDVFIYLLLPLLSLFVFFSVCLPVGAPDGGNLKSTSASRGM